MHMDEAKRGNSGLHSRETCSILSEIVKEIKSKETYYIVKLHSTLAIYG